MNNKLLREVPRPLAGQIEREAGHTDTDSPRSSRAATPASTEVKVGRPSSKDTGNEKGSF